jgi:hypothetical protein
VALQAVEVVREVLLVIIQEELVLLERLMARVVVQVALVEQVVKTVVQVLVVLEGQVQLERDSLQELDQLPLCLTGCILFLLLKLAVDHLDLEEEVEEVEVATDLHFALIRQEEQEEQEEQVVQVVQVVLEVVALLLFGDIMLVLELILQT